MFPNEIKGKHLLISKSFEFVTAHSFSPTEVAGWALEQH